MINGAVSWGRSQFSQMVQNYRTAPPVNRKFDEGYVLLGRRDENGVLKPIGAFSAELYVMALANKLPSQQTNDGHARRADGTVKTPFELAILPAITFGEIQKRFKEVAGIKVGKHVSLPAPISKYRILPDFLPHLSEMGLELYGTAKKSPVDEVKMNIRNPVANTSAFERTLHYGSQWLAWFLALSVGVETALLVGMTGPLAVLPFALGYLAHKCAKDFALFDIVEGLMRDMAWMFDRDYSLKGKISTRKSLETSAYLAGIGIAMYYGVTGAWAATLGMSGWSTLAALGAPALAVSSLSMLAAGAFAATAGLGIWLGLSYSTRYFWTFSFFDNAIKPDDVAKIAAEIPFVNRGTDGVVKQNVVRLNRAITQDSDLSVPSRRALSTDYQKKSADFTNLYRAAMKDPNETSIPAASTEAAACRKKNR